MLKRLVVGLDGSPFAETAAEYALHLAKACDGEVEAVFVPDVPLAAPPLPPADLLGTPLDLPAVPLAELQAEEQKRGDEVLAAFARRAAAASVPAAVLRGSGLPGHALVERARSADLVCLGKLGRAHEGEAAEGQAVGSTVRLVGAQAVRPVLVAPRAFRPIKRILVAYDGSNHACRALRAAIELVQARTGPEPPIYSVASVVDGDAGAAQALAAAAVTYLKAHGVVEPAVLPREGRPAERVILDVAEEIGADLIVAGAFGEHRFRELFLGSTVLELLRTTRLPVLIHH